MPSVKWAIAVEKKNTATDRNRVFYFANFPVCEKKGAAVGLNAIASRSAESHQQIRYFSRFIAFRSTNDTPRIYTRSSLRSKREPNTSERSRQRASVHGCFGGRSPCGGFFCLAYTMREGASFVCGAARETPRRKRGAIFCICVESSYLT